MDSEIKICHGVTHGDRVRFWTNFNSILLCKISEIKSQEYGRNEDKKDRKDVDYEQK